MWLLQLPPAAKLSTPFLTGNTNGLGFTPLSIWKPASSVCVGHTHSPPPSFQPAIRAMKTIQGKVVCDTNDKTVSVEVVRLAPHPKYKRRVRKKNKFQAHDPDNKFKLGDMVQLQKIKPISKTKAFLALPIPERKSNHPSNNPSPSGHLPIPLESQPHP